MAACVWTLLGLAVCILVAFTGSARGERHRIRFDNRCGFGTPHLLKDGQVLSQGKEFICTGSFGAGIAYLQTGGCNLNGEGCTVVEMTLVNPRCSGCGSSVDISLIPPLAYSVPTSFQYFNGCDGQGATCTSANCRAAFFHPDDNHVQVQCEEDDVDLLISFRPGNSFSVSKGKGAHPKLANRHRQADRGKYAALLVTPNTPESSDPSNVVAGVTSVPKVDTGGSPLESAAGVTAKACSERHVERQTSSLRSGRMPRLAHHRHLGHAAT